MDSLLTARWVLPISSPPIENGALRIQSDGRIAACGPRDRVEAELEAGSFERRDFGEAALLPGLVNVHAHLELTILRGYLEEPDFFRWIRKLTCAKYDILEPHEILASSLWGALEATRAGVTTLGEVCDIGVSREALCRSGLRAVLYQEVFGPDENDADRSLEGLREKLAEHAADSGDRVRLGISPHAAYTVSARLLERVAALALEGSYPLTIHAAESRAERQFLLSGSGPFADFLRARGIPWTPPASSAVEYLDSLGVLRTRPLLVHCVDCSRDDLARLAESGSTVAHCPKSNAKLGHGVAPLDWMLGAGIRVGLGSDSVASNNTCDLFEEARAASLLLRVRSRGDEPPRWTARDALRLMTLSGAEVLGMSGRVGSLEIGKLGDVIAVDLSSPHLQPVHDVESALLWSASARDVAFTMVGGEALYEKGAVSRLDEAALREEVSAIARKLQEASGPFSAPRPCEP